MKKGKLKEMDSFIFRTKGWNFQICSRAPLRTQETLRPTMPFRTTCLNTTSESRYRLSPSRLTHMNRSSKLWWHKWRNGHWEYIRNVYRALYLYLTRAVLCGLQRFYMHYFINASILRWNYFHVKDEKPKVQRVKGLAQGQIRHLAKWQSQDYHV